MDDGYVRKSIAFSKAGFDRMMALTEELDCTQVGLVEALLMLPTSVIAEQVTKAQQQLKREREAVRLQRKEARQQVNQLLKSKSPEEIAALLEGLKKND